MLTILSVLEMSNEPVEADRSNTHQFYATVITRNAVDYPV